MPRICCKIRRSVRPIWVSNRLGALNRYVLALLFVTLVWGGTFPVLKLLTAHLSGVEISALRFALAAVCLLPLSLQAPRKTWRMGAALGLLLLVSYVTQAYGLQFISSNRSAFLTSLNVLFVPMLAWAMGSLINRWIWAAAVTACLGVGLMSWEGGSHIMADAATVVSALTYALYVISLSRYAKEHHAAQLAAQQSFWMCLGGCAWMFLGSTPTYPLQTLPERAGVPVVWMGLLYLGVIATAGMLFLQATAQKHVSAEKAALVYAMEPVFAASIAWLWLGESLSLVAATGAGLIVVAMLVGEIKGKVTHKTV